MAENVSDGISYLHDPLIHTVMPFLSPMPIFISMDNRYSRKSGRE